MKLRQLEMQYQREREKEAHELLVMKMQFALRKGNEQTPGPGLLNPSAGDAQGEDSSGLPNGLFTTSP